MHMSDMTRPTSGSRTIAEKTYYVNEQDADRLAVHKHPKAAGERSVYVDLAGNVTMLVRGDMTGGEWQATAGTMKNPMRSAEKPTVGLSPLELWGGRPGNGGHIFDRWHIGNSITEVTHAGEPPLVHPAAEPGAEAPVSEESTSSFRPNRRRLRLRRPIQVL